MNTRREIGIERVVMMRIIATLISLAGMASRAASLPLAGRYELLEILLHSEAGLRWHVIGRVQSLGMPIARAYGQFAAPDEAEIEDDQAELVRLAYSFMEMAQLMADMIARSRQLARGISFGEAASGGASEPNLLCFSRRQPTTLRASLRKGANCQLLARPPPRGLPSPRGEGGEPGSVPSFGPHSRGGCGARFCDRDAGR